MAVRPNRFSGLLLIWWWVFGGHHHVVAGIYVSYENPHSYRAGDLLPVRFNKLTSPSSLGSMDMRYLPTCHNYDAQPLIPASDSTGATNTTGSVTNPTQQQQQQQAIEEEDHPAVLLSPWQSAIHALHGDAWVDPTVEPQAAPAYEIRTLEPRYCQVLCWMDLRGRTAERWQEAIDNDLHFQLELDHMPAANQLETRFRIAKRYWGGIPVGKKGGSHNDDDNNNNNGDTVNLVVDDDIRFRGTTSHDMFVNNHWNIEIYYQPVKQAAPDDPRYQIVQTTVQAFTIQHAFQDQADGVALENPIDSCIPPLDFDDDAAVPEHTRYDMLLSMPPQPARGRVLFTYDVIWRAVDPDEPLKRWEVFLNMGDSIPWIFQLVCIVLAVGCNVFVYGALGGRVYHDLSHKANRVRPQGEDKDGAREIEQTFLGDDDDDDDDDDMGDDLVMLSVEERNRLTREHKDRIAKLAKLHSDWWPLTPQVFGPPQYRYAMAILCGTGTHLLLAGLLFIVLFRLGVINQSIGANIITPAVALYTVTAPAAGYTTGRWAVLWGKAESASLESPVPSIICSGVTALWFPLLGIVTIHLAYDVWTDPWSPSLQVLDRSFPLMMVFLWGVFPLTVVGGIVGWTFGRWSFWPYIDESDQPVPPPLSDAISRSDFFDDCGSWISACGYRVWRNIRTPLVIVLGGMLPVLCGFVAFSYGIAGPVFLGYFSSNKLCSIAPFCLTFSCAGGVAALSFYQQLRSDQEINSSTGQRLRLRDQSYWWTVFATGSSVGLHFWFLSMTWLAVEAGAGGSTEDGHLFISNTRSAFLVWFSFLGIAAACMGGTAGMIVTTQLVRFLYAYHATGIGPKSSRNRKQPSPRVQGEHHEEENKEEPEDGLDKNARDSSSPALFDDSWITRDLSEIEEDLEASDVRRPPTMNAIYGDDDGFSVSSSAKGSVSNEQNIAAFVDEDGFSTHSSGGSLNDRRLPESSIPSMDVEAVSKTNDDASRASSKGRTNDMDATASISTSGGSLTEESYHDEFSVLSGRERGPLST